jgi:SAM-dependent methyltransferase
MRNENRRYAQLGWTYEKFNPLRKDEIAWYRQMVRRYGGPVLEMACGSGRLCTALAMAGHTVDAIDRSPTMLLRAQQRIGSLTDGDRSRIRLIQADIGEFEFPTTYRVIIIADNSLAELAAPTRVRCLCRAREHMHREGRLLITARVYNADAVAQGHIDTPWSKPVAHPITRVSVRRKTELSLDEKGNKWQGTMTYEITNPDQTVQIETCPVELARFTREDYLDLLHETGWRVDVDESVDESEEARSSIVRFVCCFN